WYISLLGTLNLALSDKYRPTLLGMERGHIIAPFFAMFEEMVITNNLQNDTWPWKILQFVQNWLALLEKMANPRGLKLKEFLIGLHMVSWLARCTTKLPRCSFCPMLSYSAPTIQSEI